MSALTPSPPPSKPNSPPRVRRRSVSRSRSPNGKAEGETRRTELDDGTVVLNLTSQEVAFVLGRQGTTKKKIARVSGAVLDLDERALVLKIKGSPEDIKRGEEYTNFVLEQRTGVVNCDLAVRRPDLTVVNVPEDVVGFVMGRGGSILRDIEDAAGTLMFFSKGAEASLDDDGQKVEKLAIFGNRKARRAAELRVMSKVEQKHSGWFLDGYILRAPFNAPGDTKPDTDEFDEWGTETFPLNKEDFSYALGRQGSTKDKIAQAAGCILEFVGFLAVVAGSKEERQRAKDYLGWLLQQKSGKVNLELKGRTDFTQVDVPASVMGLVTGSKGDNLRHIEGETNTFVFASGEKGGETEVLNIFGAHESDRLKAKRMVEDKISTDKRGGSGRDDRYDDRRNERRDDRRDDRRGDDRRGDDRRFDDRRDDRRDDDRGRADVRFDDRRRERYDDRADVREQNRGYERRAGDFRDDRRGDDYSYSRGGDSYGRPAEIDRYPREPIREERYDDRRRDDRGGRQDYAPPASGYRDDRRVDERRGDRRYPEREYAPPVPRARSRSRDRRY